MICRFRHTEALIRHPAGHSVPRQVASTKKKGDLAELRVACDLVAKGYRVAIPFGEDSDYDLVVDREGNLERVQVKYASSATGVIQVRCGSHSLTNGKVKRTKRYTAGSIDWLAVYDPEGGPVLLRPSPPVRPERTDVLQPPRRSHSKLPAHGHSLCARLRGAPRRCSFDGASGIRTRDLSDANRTLSQLSYGPFRAIVGADDPPLYPGIR